MALIRKNAQAPRFTLPTQDGTSFRLEAHLKQGHAVLLLFYPLDWTPT